MRPFPEAGSCHGGGGRVADEHGEQGGYQHESQEDVLTLLAEGREQHAGQVDVQACFGGSDSQDESADEKHHDRIGKTGHHLLVAEQLSGLGGITEPLDPGVGGEQQQQGDDGHGSGPRRHQLHDPHQGGINKNGDDPLLDLGESVHAERLCRQEPQEQEDGGHKHKPQRPFFVFQRAEFLLAPPFLHLFYQMKSYKVLEHCLDCFQFC